MACQVFGIEHFGFFLFVETCHSKTVVDFDDFWSSAELIL